MGVGGGDIVFEIGADITSLLSGGAEGRKTLASMEKSAKDLERQIGKIGQAGVAFQREMNALTGVNREFARTARESAEAFQAFDKARAQVDGLRASIDPLFAASKRYEAAQRSLDEALEMGAISALEHAQVMDQIGVAYLGGETKAVQMAGAIGRLGNISGETRGKIQMVGYQVQDMAVQFAAGTSAVTVFAQQGSQMLSVFGPFGIAAGTLAAVTLPLLGAAFASAGEETQNFDESMREVEASLARLREAANVYSAEGIQGLIDKYGELTASTLEFIEAQRQATVDKALADATQAVSAMREEFGFASIAADDFTKGATIQIMNAAKALGLTSDQVRELSAEFGRARNAATFEEKAAALARIRELLGQSTQKTSEWYFKILDAEDAMRQLNAEGARASGWLAAATGGAAALAARLWDAAKAQAALQSDAAGNATPFADGSLARQAPPGRPMDLGTPDPASGGGGGGGVNPVQAQLDQLRESLLSEEQIEIESYERRQETLQAALNQKLISQQEYIKMAEEAQRAHQEAMSEIDVWRYGDGQQKAAAFFGVMADTFQAGNERMQKMARAFGAAEALINAWRAYSQTIADPSLPFMVKFAAGAKVLAAGMAAVNAIKSGGGSTAAAGGASRGGSASAASTGGAQSAPPQPLQVNLSGFDPSKLYSGAVIGNLLDSLSKEAGDRGMKLLWSA